jgi:hypothetical protein
MKLLERAKGAAPSPGTEQEQAPPAPEGARTCAACGAVMEPDQDWCLSCGTAAPGRLGDRPGWRAASTVMALTAVLVLGAVAAGYAALHDSKRKQQTVVAAPPAQPAPETTAPPPATPPPATQPPPAQSTPTTPKTSTLPKVKTPTTPPATSAPPLTPATPPPTSSTPPATSTPSQSTPSTGTTTTPPSTGTQPQPTAPTAIEFADGAGAMYDPYGRAAASGDTAKALDGNGGTSWYVDPKDPQEVGVGYVIDVGKLRGIREIELTTPTPGFRVEVYATDEATPPPDILDTRWSHITNVSDVGAKNDGKQTIVLGAGTSKYRNLLLWFTKPPTAAPRLRLSEIKLLG